MTTEYQPVLPYDGTSGWSGSATSEERAVSQDSSGKTSVVQQQVLKVVGLGKAEGATVADLRDWYPEHHHGSLSGALSVLHKAGLIARLLDKRDRCAIYVLPEHVGDRAVAAQGRRPKKPVLTHDLVRKIVQDSIYEARNNGQTIGVAATEAANQIMQIVEGHRG